MAEDGDVDVRRDGSRKEDQAKEAKIERDERAVVLVAQSSSLGGG